VLSAIRFLAAVRDSPAVPGVVPSKKGDLAHTVIGALSFTFNIFEVTGRGKRTINRMD